MTPEPEGAAAGYRGRTPGRVMVVGGGPAGLMAAERLAALWHTVRVVEQMPTVGRKFLMAGRGGLNLTHSEPIDRFLDRFGTARDWLAPLLETLPPAALVDWAQDLGQPTFVGSSGRIFPKAMKASPLLRAWLARLQRQQVEISTGCRWTGFDAAGRTLLAQRDGAIRADRADAVVLALGGASWPRLGSDGSWVPVLRAAGVEITELGPANMALSIPWSRYMAPHFGAPLKRIAVTLAVADEPRSGGRGEAVITAEGLEGGAIYRIAGAARQSLVAGEAVQLWLDLRPDLAVDEIARRLARAPARQSVTSRLLKAAGLSAAAAALLREGAHPLPADPERLAAQIKRLSLDVTGVQGLERAISTAGGVSRAAMTDDLMLTALPGVFVAGEMLDWEAPTGGYLLQATFATAVRAAEGVARWLAAGNSRDPGKRV